MAYKLVSDSTYSTWVGDRVHWPPYEHVITNLKPSSAYDIKLLTYIKAEGGQRLASAEIPDATGKETYHCLAYSRSDN